MHFTLNEEKNLQLKKMQFPKQKNQVTITNSKFKLLLITFITMTLVTKCSGHGSSNSTDIFVAAEHVDTPMTHLHPDKIADGLNSDNEHKILSNERRRLHVDEGDGYRTPETPSSNPVPVPVDEDEVIFIRNEKSAERVGDSPHYYPRDRDDLTLTDVLRAKPRTEASITESTVGEVMFISGKNNGPDFTEKQSNGKAERHIDTRRFNDFDPKPEKKKVKKMKLNCTNLDCDNTVASVCGERIENSNPKYRLFLNHCYFRKVNCGFKFEYNRYRRVKLNKCSKVGSHSNSSPPPVEFRAFPPFNDPTPSTVKVMEYQATAIPHFRRFLNGRQCDHPCPVTCLEAFDPQCGESIDGKKQVFANHCEMDHDSCSHGTVWVKRPLSLCVGRMKAELQENRRWIHWMQKSGIVDKKGHIVLN